MNTKLRGLLQIFLLLFFYNNISAQIMMFAAKDKNYSSIAYQLSVGDTYFESKNLLIAKGYDPYKISNQYADADEKNLTTGVYVIVKSTRKESNNSEKISYGIGCSKTSYDAAEIQAVKNIAANDWNWTKKYNYTVVERNKFDIKAANSSLVAIIFMKKDAAGNKTVMNTNLQYADLTDSAYLVIKNKYSKINNPNIEINVSRLIVAGGKAAVVKTTNVSANNITIEKTKLIYAAAGSNYNLALYPEGTITKDKEPEKNILVNEMNLDKQSPGMLSDLKQLLRDKNEKDTTKKRKANTSIGIRG